jgi:hypothetical protein
LAKGEKEAARTSVFDPRQTNRLNARSDIAMSALEKCRSMRPNFAMPDWFYGHAGICKRASPTSHMLEMNVLPAVPSSHSIFADIKTNALAD